MKPRRGHSNYRRQTGVILSSGGLILESETHNVATGDGADWNQQTFAIASESQSSATGHAQPAHHAIPSFDFQFSSTVENEESLSSIASVTPTSFASSIVPTTVTSSILFSHRSSSLLTDYCEPSSSRPSGSSTSAAFSVPSNVDESSASASSVPTTAAASHSAEFYGGIAFISVASLACVLAIVIYLLRSRRKGAMWCGSSKKDEDVENQVFGRGLGLYVDKPASHGAARSPIGYPATFMRPVAPHLPTENSVRSPSRLLGPLRVRNYVSGDNLSSSDETVPTPNCEVGSPRERQPGGMPRYLGLQSQGRNVPWAPLNVNASGEPNQVNIAHSATKKSGLVQASDQEQSHALPTPPFGLTRPRNDCEKRSSNEWRDTFGSSVHGAHSGINGGNSHRGENNSPALPGSYPRSDRWRTVLSSQKALISDVVTSESAGGISVNPEAQTLEHPPAKLRQGPITFNTIGLRLRMGEQGVGGAVPSTAPLAVSKKLGTRRQSKRRPGSVKPKAMPRTNSVYSQIFGAGRQSTKRTPNFAKRDSVSQSSMTTRVRPEFLRQVTTESATSFSSEASEPSRALTAEELRAKRALMLRARRKRGMGTGSGTRTERLTRRLTHTEQSPDTEPSGA